MNYFLNICRIIAGSVFLFSGIVKGVDPYGSMLKFIDYFTAFNLDELNRIALILSGLLSMAEFLIGFAILTGIRFKEANWGLIFFMGVFTPLTLVLAINNPVRDCGCFGDAIHLTNWQTFIKNIVLLIFVIPLFTSRKKFLSNNGISREWITITGATLIFFLFSLYNYRHLPLVDFRPYSIGVDIEESMKIPEDAPVDEYNIKLLYERDGVVKEFNLNNYPSDDTSWIFVDQKSILIKRGYEPPVHDFILTSPGGDDLTEFVLNNPEITFIMVARHISDAKPEFLSKGITAGQLCTEYGIDFYLLTASADDEVKSLGTDFNYLFGDDTMLKTVIRANPGFIVLKDGIITAKWSARDLPAGDKLYQEIVKSRNGFRYNSTIRISIILGIALLISFITWVLYGKNNSY